MKEVSKEMYEACGKGIVRWERIVYVATILRTALCDKGDEELKIPSCALCGVEKIGCERCIWWEKCNDPDSHWREVCKAAGELKDAVKHHLDKARCHFLTLTASKPEVAKEEKAQPTLGVGDIVKVKDRFTDREMAGEVGKIVVVDSDGHSSLSIGVEFQRAYLGGGDCRRNAKSGHGRWGDADELELVYKAGKDC